MEKARSSYAVQIILHSHLQYENCTATMVGTVCSQDCMYSVAVMKSTTMFRRWLGLQVCTWGCTLVTNHHLRRLTLPFKVWAFK